MEKIKLKKDLIQSNLEYERDLLTELETEIDSIHEYLDFILSSKTDELSITRKIIQVEATSNYCPSEYYRSGVESGTYQYDSSDTVRCEESFVSNKFEKFEKFEWIEWSIQYENISYPDSFRICLTPFVLSINSNRGSLKSLSLRDIDSISIFTDKFWERWNDELKKYAIKKKKEKLKIMMEMSYQILDIQRERRLKDILG